VVKETGRGGAPPIRRWTESRPRRALLLRPAWLLTAAPPSSRSTPTGMQWSWDSSPRAMLAAASALLVLAAVAEAEETDPPTPPLDWQAAIASGDMKFSAASAATIRTGYFPVVANGFLGLETGPFVQPFHDAWPWLDAGLVGMSGIYSGHASETPSHRAQIPKLSDLSLMPESGAVYAAVGCAIDYSTGVYYNRTRVVSGAARCPAGTVIEQRLYAHRGLRELLVFEVRAFEERTGTLGASCTVPVDWQVSPAATPPVAPSHGDRELLALDVNLTETAPGGGGAPAVWSGTTSFAEQENGTVRSLAVAFSSAAGAALLRFTPHQPMTSVFGVFRSDLDVPVPRSSEGVAAVAPASPAQVAAAAVTTFTSYTSGPNASATLFASHTAEMRRLWSSGGVELEGNSSFAATVNASLYDIVSSLRADWNWSTSPGGLGTGGYGGWTYWCARRCDMAHASNPPMHAYALSAFRRLASESDLRCDVWRRDMETWM
jgi:hypothetical protein